MLVVAALLTSLLAPLPAPLAVAATTPSGDPPAALLADPEGGSPTLEGSFAQPRGVVTSAAEAARSAGSRRPSSR